MPNDTASSLFHSLQENLKEDFSLTVMTKDSLITLNHLLEDIILTKGLTGLLLTGFHNSAYWEGETERYNKLLGGVNTVCIFATEELTFETGNAISITLLPNEELSSECFLIIVTAAFSVILCARDQLLNPENETAQKSEVFLSFDPTHIIIALDILQNTLCTIKSPRLQDFKLARTNFTPGLTQPHYFNLIFGQFMEQLDKYSQVAQQLKKERTIRTLISELLHETSQPLTALLLTLQMSQVTKQLSPEDMDFMQQAVYSLHERMLKLRQAVSQKEIFQLRSDKITQANGEELIG